MTWFGWTLIAFQCLAALLMVSSIGEQGKPTTHRSAIISLVISALIVVGILTIGTGSL